MRIVLIGTAYPLRGGIAHYIGLLWKYLSRRHEVLVVTFSRQYPRLFFPGTSQEEQGDPGIALPSERWIDSVNPFSWVRTALRLRRRRPDVLVFKYWMPFFAPAYGTIAALTRFRRHTRVVFICDNVIPHERRPFDRALTRFAFAFADGFIVQSRAVERDLVALKPCARYALVPHPVYEIFGREMDRASAREALRARYPSIALDPSERVLLFFGYVRDYKGLDILLEAMPLILARTPAKLLVVGEFYAGEQGYREQAERLGITGNVVFHASYVPNEDVALFFSAADVLTLPYKSATQSGIVQIAYNFHRPVIATDVGGLAETVLDGRTGAVVPPNDPRSLADAVHRFYEEGLFERWRANVVEEKKRYSWDALAEAIERLAQGIPIAEQSGSR